MAHEPASLGEPLQTADPRAVAIVTGIQLGDERAVQRWLVEHPSLATVRIVDEHGVARSLLHVAADWPGHYPNVANIVRVLIAAGAILIWAVDVDTDGSPTVRLKPVSKVVTRKRTSKKSTAAKKA